MSPDNRFFVVVGDSADGFLADSQTGKVMHSVGYLLSYTRNLWLLWVLMLSEVSLVLLSIVWFLFIKDTRYFGRKM